MKYLKFSILPLFLCLNFNIHAQKEYTNFPDSSPKNIEECISFLNNSFNPRTIKNYITFGKDKYFLSRGFRGLQEFIEKHWLSDNSPLFSLFKQSNPKLTKVALSYIIAHSYFTSIFEKNFNTNTATKRFSNHFLPPSVDKNEQKTITKKFALEIEGYFLFEILNSSCNMEDIPLGIEKGQKFGIVSKELDLITEPIYDEIGKYCDVRNSIIPLNKVRIGKKIGLIDKNGKEFIPVKYDCLEVSYSEIVGSYDKLWHRYEVEKNGKINEIPFLKDRTEDECQCFDATMLIYNENQKPKKSLVLEDGREKVPPIYDNISFHEYSFPFKGSIATYRKNGKKGIWDYGNDRILLPFDYDEIEGVVGKDFINAKKAGLWGIINSKNEVVLPFMYQMIGAMYEDSQNKKRYFSSQKNGKWGIVNESNSVVLPFTLQDIWVIQGSTDKKNILIYAKKNEKWGVINIDGIEIVQFIYQNKYEIKID